MEEIINCPICNSNNIKKNIILRDYYNNGQEYFTYSLCQDCRNVFLSNRPSSNEISKYYSNNYQPYLGQYNPLVRWFIEHRTSSEIKLFNKFNANVKNVLEIGCAYGQYLKDLRDMAGYEVTGVEMDAECCQRGREEYNIDIKLGKLFDAAFPNDSFDLVIMNHVIEHLYNPKETIKEINRILRKDGLVSIKTPQLESMERKWFGKYWMPYEAPRHLFIFSAGTLSQLLENNGYKIVKVIYEKTPNNIILSFRSTLIDKKYPKWLIDFFNINNYFLLALFTPVSFLLGTIKQSGRMVVIAQK